MLGVVTRDRVRRRARTRSGGACRSRSRSSASPTRKACASARRCSAAARSPARSTRALLDKPDARRHDDARGAARFGLDPAQIAAAARSRERRARLRRAAHRAGAGARSRRPAGRRRHRDQRRHALRVDAERHGRPCRHGADGAAPRRARRRRRMRARGRAHLPRRRAGLVGTVGRIEARPGAINVIPGRRALHARRARARRRRARAPRSRDIAASSTAIARARGVGARRSSALQDSRHGAVRAVAACEQIARGHRRAKASSRARCRAAPATTAWRWSTSRRHRHAVRALQGRHQPQSGRGRARRTTSAPARACCCASSRISCAAGDAPMTPATTDPRVPRGAARSAQTRFLAELVQNAVGQSAGRLRAARRAHRRAARGAGLRGRAPRRCPPDAVQRERHGRVHQSHRARALRRRAGRSRSTRTATSCRRARAGAPTRTARRFATARCTAAASRSRNRTSRPTPSRCWRSKAPRRAARTARSSCISPTTRRPAATIGPGWLLEQGLSQARLRDLRRLLLRHRRRRTTAACISRSRCSGKSAHAARARRRASTRSRRRRGILAALYALRARATRRSRSAMPGIGRPTLVVGLDQGGINTNVVPDRVTLPARPAHHSRGGRRQTSSASCVALIAGVARGIAGIAVEVRRILLARAVRAACRARSGWSRRCSARARRHGRADRAARRAALHRCAPLRRGRHSDRAVRRRAAHARGGERPPRRREAASSTISTRRPRSSRSRCSSCYWHKSCRIAASKLALDATKRGLS